MRAIIVGDGPSAAGFVPPDGVFVIAVKGAIKWLSRADAWFSLDPNQRTLDMVTKPRPGVWYYCACDPQAWLPRHVIRMRRIAARGVEPTEHGSPEWWLWRWSAVCGLCEHPGRIHTGNSAWGALGLAYHLGYRDVLLVGVDGTADERVSGGAPSNMSHLPLLFESALGQVRLSTVGRLGRVPHTTLEDWICESMART